MTKDTTHRDRTTDLGVVRINNEAIMAIASVAAMEVKGVHRMGASLRRTLCDLFRKTTTTGVKIQMRDSEVKLSVFIVVNYGVDIPRIADEVQENVKRAVEKMAGLALGEVDVVVEGVHTNAPGEKR